MTLLIKANRFWVIFLPENAYFAENRGFGTPQRCKRILIFRKNEYDFRDQRQKLIQKQVSSQS